MQRFEQRPVGADREARRALVGHVVAHAVGHVDVGTEQAVIGLDEGKARLQELLPREPDQVGAHVAQAVYGGLNR